MPCGRLLSVSLYEIFKLHYNTNKNNIINRSAFFRLLIHSHSNLIISFKIDLSLLYRNTVM